MIFEKIKNLNYLLIFLLILLSFIGAAGLYSAADGSYNPWASRHLVRFYVFLLMAIVISLIDIKLIYKYAYLIFILSLLLLVSVEIIGVLGKGATRWIRIFGFSIQPSELVKITIILALAKFYHDIKFENIKKISFLFFPFLILIIPFIFVVIQPDLGTSIMVLISGILPVLISGFPVSYQIIGIVTILLSTPFIWMNLLDYQKQRVLTFFDPGSDPLGTGWNIIQSQIAVGSGSLFGKGFLQGTQSQLNFVPESHTDFIFAVVAEEFGLFGVMGLFLVYLLLAFRLVMIAKNSNFLFVKLVAGTFIFLLLTYVAFNTAMVVGILPVVGMPLPFLSQGGTALIINMIMIGIILSFRRTA